MEGEGLRQLSLINKTLWDGAGWQGTAFLVKPEDDYPPGIGIVFRNYHVGSKIFSDWRRSFGLADQNDLLRLSIVTGIHPSKGEGIAVLLSTDLDGIERAKRSQPDLNFESLVLVSCRHLFRAVPQPYAPLTRFRDEFARHHRYFIVPIPATSLGTAFEPDWDLMLGKQIVYFRTFSELAVDDVDVAVLDP